MTSSTNNHSLPNMPLPINGLVKSYDHERKFIRPYSAKNVIFYKGGDEWFQGVRLPISKAKYRTMDALMDDLTHKMDITYGVRRVYTPNGQRQVMDVNELENMGRLVKLQS